MWGTFIRILYNLFYILNLFYTRDMQKNQPIKEDILSQQSLSKNSLYQVISKRNTIIIGVILLAFLIGILLYFSSLRNTSIKTYPVTPGKQQSNQSSPIPSTLMQTPLIRHWIIAEYVPNELDSNPSGAQFIKSINNPTTYEILDMKRKKPDLLPNATHVEAFDSYQAIQSAFVNNTIPSNIKVILYDNERWPGTPLIEQQ